MEKLNKLSVIVRRVNHRNMPVDTNIISDTRLVVGEAGLAAGIGLLGPDLVLRLRSGIVEAVRIQNGEERISRLPTNPNKHGQIRCSDLTVNMDGVMVVARLNKGGRL